MPGELEQKRGLKVVPGGRRLLAIMLAAGVGAGAAGAAPPPKPGARPTRPPAAPPSALTPQSLTAALKSLGYKPTPHGAFQRVPVEEAGKPYGYAIDVGFSANKEWLVVLANLAPIPDLTKVPSTPLLALLTTNDSLLGMAFSYDRQSGRVMLNAAVPTRSASPGTLRSILDEVRAVVARTEGLWDPTHW